MAPAIGVGHRDASVSAIRIPVYIVARGADDITPLATNAERFAALIPTATLTRLGREGRTRNSWKLVHSRGIEGHRLGELGVPQ
jgi:hypothetical protein